MLAARSWVREGRLRVLPMNVWGKVALFTPKFKNMLHYKEI